MLERPVILAVDDEPNILKLISINLAMDGLAVYTASDADSALVLFEAVKPDLVLIDIMMPGTDGLELVDIIRGRSHVPIIMLTARGDTASIQHALVNGADDYITKPFNLKLLTARVRAKISRVQTLSQKK